ncbi:uncharacterized protein KD926_002643 [Aspergillus affinis]|uniref:uncharacterized protein n=1 Tax=Aspergillus affinis TaxID=1070780 RepID=UPI0022FDDB2B|nr:uncharacterized protein KD926_002643 [Aspergillus affinis]KAI9035889.1 hypothetical protein KD926_002643 [Aspergillus affinis]
MVFTFNSGDRSTPPEVFNKKLFLVVVVATCGSTIFGYDLAFISGVFSLPAFIDRFDLANQNAYAIQAHMGSAFFGAMVVYFVNERWGRRFALLWASFIFNVGVVLCMACRGNIPVFYVGRIASGLGVGASIFVIPQYLSECAPPTARGGIVGCLWFRLHSIWLILTLCNSSRLVPKLVPSLDFGSTMEFNRRSRQMELETDLAPTDSLWGIMEESFTPRMLPRVVHGCLLMILQNSTCINAMNNFSVTFFNVLGFHGTSAKLLSTGLYGIVKVVAATITFLFLIDRFGRRLLFAGSSVSWNIPWIIAAVIFPTRILSFCLVLTTCPQWLGEFYTSYAVTYMFASITYGTFIFFGTMTVIGGIYVYLLVPKTKGVALEDMDYLFGGKGLALQKMRRFRDRQMEAEVLEGRSATPTEEELAEKEISVSYLVNPWIRKHPWIFRTLDLLKIGNQSRPEMFALNVLRPSLLYSKVVEVDERVTLHESTSYRREANDGKIITNGNAEHKDADVVTGVSGEKVRIIQKLDTTTVAETLQQVYDQGFRSVAICLLHSYTFPDHEMVIASEAERIGFTQISTSCRISPAIRMLSRASSAVTDAYLTPQIRDYLKGFESGVKSESLAAVNWRIMQSDGGLVHPSKLSGLHALLSGPAGGVVGYARTCFSPEIPVPVIGFDMGGTSTDVSRYAGSLEHVFETVTASIPIQVPQLDINTVAAGGGNILSWRKGILTVGPDSAGSHPGPACYRKGRPATVTDANLILGQIIPSFFPSIFGPEQNQPLVYHASYQKMKTLGHEINTDQASNLSVEEVAQGFITVANEAMCRPIRAITEARGYRTGEHNLAYFGGAGGQHAYEIAKQLGISRVLIHKYSAILSGYGMALANTVQEAHLPYSKDLPDTEILNLKPVLDGLRQETIKSIIDMDPTCNKTRSIYFLNLRYDGSDTSLMIEKPEESWNFRSAFIAHHQREFGFTPNNRGILIDDIRVRTVADSGNYVTGGIWELDGLSFHANEHPVGHTPVSFPELDIIKVPLYSLLELRAEDSLKGTAVVIDNIQTIVVSPGAEVKVLSSMLVIDLAPPSTPSTYEIVDPIRLSVFAIRFMGIAEQMGRSLQKTSVSTNIKERLDFSCAIFSADGGLVANAPHVPAMLGSMAFAVKWQIQHWGSRINNGDVFLTNSPNAGGTHLPDLTVITPIFDDEGKKILF